MKRLLILMALMLTACSGGKAIAPLGHYSSKPTQQTRSAANAPLSYTVRKGDTLYSISFRYGIDYRNLAWRSAHNLPPVSQKQQRQNRYQRLKLDQHLSLNKRPLNPQNPTIKLLHQHLAARQPPLGVGQRKGRYCRVFPIPVRLVKGSKLRVKPDRM